MYRIRESIEGKDTHSIGTSTVPLSSSVANKVFFPVYTRCTATSGGSRNHYIRHYVKGAGGSGEAVRSFTTVDTSTAATCHGAHISLNFANGGKLSGLGCASRSTLHIPDSAGGVSGTLAAVQAEIYSDGAASTPAGALTSFFRVINDGHATGKGLVEDNTYFATIVGCTAGDGKMLRTNTTTATHGLKINIDGTRYDILLTDTHA